MYTVHVLDLVPTGSQLYNACPKEAVAHLHTHDATVDAIYIASRTIGNSIFQLLILMYSLKPRRGTRILGFCYLARHGSVGHGRMGHDSR